MADVMGVDRGVMALWQRLDLALTNLCAVFACFLVSIYAQAMAEESQEGSPPPVLLEDFGSLDYGRWNITEGKVYRQERTVETFVPSAVELHNGKLRITARRYKTGNVFTSGEITSRGLFSFRYGRVDVRARFSKAAGTWSAAYLLPANGHWPPELDIVEHIGAKYEQVIFSNHYRYGLFGIYQLENHWLPREFINPLEWHEYSIIWTPDRVRWLVDNREVFQIVEGVPHEPMYLRLNLLMGGTFAGQVESFEEDPYAEFDYIRISDLPGVPVEIAALPGSVETVWDFVCGPVIPVLVCVFLVVPTMRREHRSSTDIKKASLASIFCSVSYLYWRFVHNNWEQWWFTAPFVACDLLSAMTFCLSLHAFWPRKKSVVSVCSPLVSQKLFVLVPVCSEPPAVIRKTLEGCISAKVELLERAPGCSVTIAIGNDAYVAGHPGQAALIARMAQECGVHCITRKTGGDYKAGNLNYMRTALQIPDDALIAIFDADMRPSPSFFVKTLGFFSDQSVGWVQTPQHYRNSDNILCKLVNGNYEFFFCRLLQARQNINAVMMCGTNVVIRAKVLAELGGVPRFSLTEDLAISILAGGRWRGVCLPEYLAEGLGPEDFAGFVSQQVRWAIGAFQCATEYVRLCLLGQAPLLSFAQKIQYLGSVIFWMSRASLSVMCVMTPLAVIFSINVMHDVSLVTYLMYFIPMIFSNFTTCFGLPWKFVLASVVLEFGSSFGVFSSLVNWLFRGKATWVITPKGRGGRSPLKTMLPFLLSLVLVALSCAANSLPHHLGLYWSTLNGVFMLLVVALFTILHFQLSSSRPATKVVRLPEVALEELRRKRSTREK